MTRQSAASPRNFNPRSPHGERRGGVSEHHRAPLNFNPRSPHGERPSRSVPSRSTAKISIHAPRTGSDDRDWLANFARQNISIHAPRTGSDQDGRTPGRRTPYFNPRSPHGERRCQKVRNGLPAAFQSTLPARGATRLPHCLIACLAYFNPRSPHGERPSTAVDDGVTMHISIHAPRTGSDVERLHRRRRVGISIHAPRTGSDVLRVLHKRLFCRFQSTLPARGATKTWFTP